MLRKLTIAFCLVVAFLLAINVCLTFTRGYGFLHEVGSFFPYPRFQSQGWISSIGSVVEGIPYIDRYPDISQIKQHLKSNEMNLSDTQPYDDIDIYIINCKDKQVKKTYQFLYQSTAIPEFHNQGGGFYWSTIYVASLGRWSPNKEKYVSYPSYPIKIEEQLKNYWCYSGYYVYGEIEGDLPPIPGCIAVKDKDNKKTIYYPPSILPAFKEIYPNIEVPKELIADIAEIKVRYEN